MKNIRGIGSMIPQCQKFPEGTIRTESTSSAHSNTRISRTSRGKDKGNFSAAATAVPMLIKGFRSKVHTLYYSEVMLSKELLL